MTNSAAEQQEAYQKMNQHLYDSVVKYNTFWAEHPINNFSAASSPDTRMVW